MGHDHPKDSTMNCNLIARALDKTMELLNEWGDKYSMPGHLLVSADNTPRESQNSNMATFLAYLQGIGAFTSCLYYLMI